MVTFQSNLWLTSAVQLSEEARLQGHETTPSATADGGWLLVFLSPHVFLSPGALSPETFVLLLLTE